MNSVSLRTCFLFLVALPSFEIGHSFTQKLQVWIYSHPRAQMVDCSQFHPLVDVTVLIKGVSFVLKWRGNVGYKGPNLIKHEVWGLFFFFPFNTLTCAKKWWGKCPTSPAYSDAPGLNNVLQILIKFDLGVKMFLPLTF